MVVDCGALGTWRTPKKVQKGGTTKKRFGGSFGLRAQPEQPPFDCCALVTWRTQNRKRPIVALVT